MYPDDPWGFSAPPFRLVPDTRFLFLHERFARARTMLFEAAVEGKGFASVVGEVGSGKTILLRSLAEEPPPDTEVAVLFQTDLSPAEFFIEVARELGLSPPEGASRAALLEAIRDKLLELHAAGKTALLLIDEAQNLPFETLEAVRMLSNLETGQAKLVQIFFFGQDEFAEKLLRPEARQLRSRIAVSVRLSSLSYEEVRDYIAHRIETARPAVPVHFARSALRAVYRLSGGNPRLVTLLAGAALEEAARSARRDRPPPGAIEARHVRRAATTLLLAPPPARRFARAALVAAAVAAGAGAVWLGVRARPGPPPAPAAPAVSPPETEVPAAPAPAEAIVPVSPAPEAAAPSETAPAAAAGETAPPQAALPPPRLRPLVVSVRTDRIGHWPIPFALVPQPPLATDTDLPVLAADAGAIEVALGDARVRLPRARLPARLFVRGEVDENRVPVALLRPGTQSEEVRKVKEALRALGRYFGPADDRYDDSLAEAVRSLQRDLGLVPDGVYGPQTALGLFASLRLVEDAILAP